jgi:DNA-binding beta-propeller fold protein YncE
MTKVQIDTTTNKVIGSPIPVGSEPWGIAITPTPPTLANTQIVNGTDTGTLNEADTPGDVILIYTSTMGKGTITCNTGDNDSRASLWAISSTTTRR